jgi:phosphoglucosamine mutase
MGSDALTLGVIPTPAVAFLTREYHASCGIVISASHNPFMDNGLKIFGSNGYKLPDEVETQIEDLILARENPFSYAEAGDIGRVYAVEEAANRYVHFLLDCCPGLGSRRLKLVVDCANGAAYETAPELWNKLGMDVVVLHDQPNGVNINAGCGSTDLQDLQQAVLLHQADMGVAYDGDADRCLAVDEQGQEVDGDMILTICALALHRSGRLTPNQVVGTVMSNIGFNLTLQKETIIVHNSPVGDRYVLEKMQQTGAVLGGEASGHVIFHQYATTGDGLLTSLKLAEVMQGTGRKLSELAAEMQRFPQVLVNVRTAAAVQKAVLQDAGYKAKIEYWEKALQGQGKILVRPSGTEPLIRILAQGLDNKLLEEIVEDIRQYIVQYQA